uniref:Venom s1 protease with cub domain 10 n=1 Tax=Pristhesancus plagipennis TaxID=1955184 RepID=A0A1Q1NPK4_PRIPG|nr:venom s1 protease with cub domain 10 [Pristhesancus plagipennis]
MGSKFMPVIYVGLYIFCAKVLGQQEVYNIHIQQGYPEILKNPEYPGNPYKYESTLQWNLQVEPDASIKLFCSDLRMGQNQPLDNECTHVSFRVDDGVQRKKICGPSKSGFMFISQGPRLTVTFVSTSAGSGFVYCTALNLKEPEQKETINLQRYGKAQLIELSKNAAPNLDKMWLLRSTPGTRISLQCDISLSKGKDCELNILTFYNGQVNTNYCGGEKLELFTKDNNGKVRVQLNENGKGKVRCVVQAITGPNLNEHDNVVSEEIDSSEHGMTPGRRNTSCNCGRANKHNARIFFGNETKPNEFPWMVDLIIIKSYASRCGASVITGRHILTAAHCVVDKFTRETARPENVIAVLAEHDRSLSSGNEVRIPSERIIIHEEYLNDGTKDVAVVYTSERIPFTQRIGPICLEPNPLPINNRRIIIMGWGLTEKGSESNLLLRARARVVDTLICGGKPYDVCTSPKESNMCNGDSGSPLAWVDPETNRYVQVSLVSRGHDCKSAIGFSTEVAYFYNWIQDKIQRTNPSEATCHKV